MNSREIKEYRENVVRLVTAYDTEGQSALGELLRFQALAVYEVALQLAELNESLAEVAPWGPFGRPVRTEGVPR